MLRIVGKIFSAISALLVFGIVASFFAGGQPALPQLPAEEDDIAPEFPETGESVAQNARQRGSILKKVAAVGLAGLVGITMTGTGFYTGYAHGAKIISQTRQTVEFTRFATKLYIELGKDEAKNFKDQAVREITGRCEAQEMGTLPALAEINPNVLSTIVGGNTDGWIRHRGTPNGWIYRGDTSCFTVPQHALLDREGGSDFPGTITKRSAVTLWAEAVD
ncbi:MAG: hypothetical protein HZC02_02810 [Candidatus Levybacteria bacterium]|nr:hypothetical protein [Candidatus Levybacteria bacterium]